MGLGGSREPPVELLEKAVLEAPEKLPLAGSVDTLKSNQCSSSVGDFLVQDVLGLAFTCVFMWGLSGSGCHLTLRGLTPENFAKSLLGQINKSCHPYALPAEVQVAISITP